MQQEDATRDDKALLSQIRDPLIFGEFLKPVLNQKNYESLVLEMFLHLEAVCKKHAVVRSGMFPW
jgi:hypothetical protein